METSVRQVTVLPNCGYLYHFISKKLYPLDLLSNFSEEEPRSLSPLLRLEAAPDLISAYRYYVPKFS